MRTVRPSTAWRRWKGARSLSAAPLLFALLGAPLAAQPRAQTDSTPGARALARVVDAVTRRALETSLPARMAAGLPMERLPDLSVRAAREDGAWAARQLAAVAAIAPSDLSAEERLTRELLRWELGLRAEAPQHQELSFAVVTPYATPIGGIVQAFGMLPLRDASDGARYERLLGDMPGWLDTIRTGLVTRAAAGVRLAADEIPAVVALLRSYRQPAASSPFMPRGERLAGLPAAERERLETAARRIVEGPLDAAFERLAGTFDSAYVAAAPRGLGLWQYEGGAAYYRFLVRAHTTTTRTPAEIHDIGQREVARIEQEMAAIRGELGFTGTAREFLDSLRRDPRFYARTPEEVGERLVTYLRRIEPVIAQAFAVLPRARGDVRRLDPRLEAAQTFGYYDPPSPADSMGHYYYNASRLPERNQVSAGALLYHELLPGHHLQVARQRENLALPAFRRTLMQTAYTEGWGEYASQLAGELGMMPDPYERYGRLLMEMFVACRLVVDTGLHELRWTRAQATEFMAARVIESPTQLATETLRYGADLPAQALAYKMGAVEINRLRDRARAALGPRFDLRAFHEVVLGSGSLPLAVLEGKVEAWLAAQP